MSILVQLRAPTEITRAPTSASHFEFAPLAKPSPQLDVHRNAQKERIKALLNQRRYKQIVDTRLTHIPTRLPFPNAAIVHQLELIDRLSENRAALERMVDIEAELSLVSSTISAPTRELGGTVAAKERRLSAIWDFLSLSAKRFDHIHSQRIGRLNYNIRLFSQSDLPPSYIVEIGESTYWESAALAIARNAEVARLIGNMCGQSADDVTRESFLGTHASLRDIENAFRSYSRQLRRITSVSDKVLGWRDALEYYVDLFSAGDIERFRRLREISVSTLDNAILGHLYVGLEGATAELRRTLVSHYPSQLADFKWVPENEAYLTGVVQLGLEMAQAD